MPDLSLAWTKRTLVATGPATFYLAIPVTGPPPSAASAYEFIAALQDACRDHPTSDGMRVRAVRGTISATTRGSHLSLYITVGGASGDAHHDATFVESAIHFGLRRTTTGRAPSTGPLRRVPDADHRDPSAPPPVEGFASATYERQRQLEGRSWPAEPTNGWRRPNAL